MKSNKWNRGIRTVKEFAGRREQAPCGGKRLSLKITIKEIGKHGNVILNTAFDEMESVGIGIGDVITVKAGESQV